MARLAAEPGLVVLDADRSFGHGRVTGLRDPLAADPVAILAGFGFDSAQVEWRWRPYLSLEPAVVLARARRTLGAPATVELALRGDTLVATGAGPIGWLARAAAPGTLPPGVARIELGSVEPTLSADGAPLKTLIEGSRVLCGVGSAVISADQRDSLAKVASAAARLLTAERAPGYRVELVLEGRTDPTGSDAANQSLSRLRAEEVARALGARGVAPGALVLQGLGTSQPIGGSLDGEARARANRSVSFAIKVTPDTGERRP